MPEEITEIEEAPAEIAEKAIVLLPCMLPREDAAMAALQPVTLNGRKYPLAFNTPLSLPENVVDVLRASGLDVLILPDSPAGPAGSGDAAAGTQPGGESGGSDSFDVEAIIAGTVSEVKERLAGLTPEQLELVRAAETDREVPRKGVAQAIADAIAPKE